MTVSTDSSAWSMPPHNLENSSAATISAFDAIAPDTPLVFPSFIQEANQTKKRTVVNEQPFVAGRDDRRSVPIDRRDNRQARECPRSPLARPDTVEIWDCPFSRLTMDQTLDHIERLIVHRHPSLLVTANLNYLMLMQRSARLRELTRRAALVLCDGMPILWRSQLEQRPLPQRVAGADLIYRLAERSAERGWKVYMLGGAPEVTGEAAKKLLELYPGLTICGLESPPYGDWSAEQRRDMNRRIVEASPDILLVAFGQPKGELWIEDNLDLLGVPLAMQIGASFDFVVGAAKRAPKWMQRIGAEWLYRMLSEPRRLAPRYVANAWYLIKTIRQDLLRALS